MYIIFVTQDLSYFYVYTFHSKSQYFKGITQNVYPCLLTKVNHGTRDQRDANRGIESVGDRSDHFCCDQNAPICDVAKIVRVSFDESTLFGESIFFGESTFFGESIIFGESTFFGESIFFGESTFFGESVFFGAMSERPIKSEKPLFLRK